MIHWATMPGFPLRTELAEMSMQAQIAGLEIARRQRKGRASYCKSETRTCAGSKTIRLLKHIIHVNSNIYFKDAFYHIPCV